MTYMSKPSPMSQLKKNQEKTVKKPLEETAVFYLRWISKNADLVDAQTEKDLVRRAQQGDERAKKEMAQANLRLVINMAKKYAGRGADFMDLVQEGNIGLMRAIEKFDPDKGFRFSTYASWWIKQHLYEAFADYDRPIRLPAHILDSINKMKEARKELKKALDRQPTHQELAEKLEISEKKLHRLIRASKKAKSLDAKIDGGDDNSQSLVDIICDDSYDPEATIVAEHTIQNLKKALFEELDDKERDILSQRYNLTHQQEKKRTLKEIGESYGVTRECIRQAEIRALKKLRLSKYLHHLAD